MSKNKNIQIIMFKIEMKRKNEKNKKIFKSVKISKNAEHDFKKKLFIYFTTLM